MRGLSVRPVDVGEWDFEAFEGPGKICETDPLMEGNECLGWK